MSNLSLPVLKVNRNWTPIGTVSARQAFSDISAGAMSFVKFIDGYPTVHNLESWLELQPREGDDYVSTQYMHDPRKIMVPRVEICLNYKDFRSKAVKCNRENLHRRYGGKDAWGNPIAIEDVSREHVTPQSHGGKDGWENEVPMHKRENSRRGNKPYHEVGLPEPKILPAPPPLLPINQLINTRGWPEWDMFHIPRVKETA